ncbi:MAG TPA: succinyl-diaminopimelate desuccinylase [Xanthobacteraceae bacterium]|nr:succinyl-diaminopimelate desuccinylase [Xanthobacteraceae bacterium]
MSAPHDPVELTRDLLRCPSVTPADAGAVGVLERVLGAAGFTVERITFSEPGAADIDNLYARIGTTGPNLAFAGHTDVVPPGDDAAWQHGPFTGEIVDGVLFGRGAVDMKGGIACFVAAALDHLAANGGKPKGSISFLITGDEEGVAVNGTVKLMQWAAAKGETFDHCIVGEPSSVATLGDCIKVGRRGSQSGTLVVTGKQGHVAYPERADNPIRGIATIIAGINAEPVDHGSAQFGPSNLEFTSVDVGNPTANVIPAEARARFNIRFNDNHDQASLRALIEQRVAKLAGEKIRWRIDWEPSNADSFITRPGPFVQTVVNAIETVTGITPDLSTTGGTSDARFIKNYCPVLEFGLVGQTMHQIDECVSLKDLEKLTEIYRHVLQRYFA